MPQLNVSFPFINTTKIHSLMLEMNAKHVKAYNSEKCHHLLLSILPEISTKDITVKTSHINCTKISKNAKNKVKFF